MACIIWAILICTILNLNFYKNLDMRNSDRNTGNRRKSIRGVDYTEIVKTPYHTYKKRKDELYSIAGKSTKKHIPIHELKDGLQGDLEYVKTRYSMYSEEVELLSFLEGLIREEVEDKLAEDWFRIASVFGSLFNVVANQHWVIGNYLNLLEKCLDTSKNSHSNEKDGGSTKKKKDSHTKRIKDKIINEIEIHDEYYPFIRGGLVKNAMNSLKPLTNPLARRYSSLITTGDNEILEDCYLGYKRLGIPRKYRQLSVLVCLFIVNANSLSFSLDKILRRLRFIVVMKKKTLNKDQICMLKKLYGLKQGVRFLERDNVRCLNKHLPRWLNGDNFFDKIKGSLEKRGKDSYELNMNVLQEKKFIDYRRRRTHERGNPGKIPYLTADGALVVESLPDYTSCTIDEY